MLKRESNQNWMKARVCHSLPGRLRLTATGLRFLPDNGRALAEALARFGGMRRVRVNTVVESVLLEYDPERLDAQPRRNTRKWHSPALPWTPCAPATALPRARTRRRACPPASSPAAWRSTQERCCWAIRRCAARRGRGGLASSPACRR